MPSLADTIRQLQARQFAPAAAALTAVPTRLQRLPPFGSNPGALQGWSYVPEGRGEMALVVVLHGCTQTAGGYDRGSGWSDLAERHGFAVLFPEQQRANNQNLCFNWFVEDDIAREGGEAQSIRQMVGALAGRHPIDPRRVFVTGLSAGGAMAGVMLATYPELFAGGSIIAGLPYAAARSVPQAFERMRGTGHPGETDYADAVRRASPHRGPWPRVSVWHGDADRTVDAANAEAVLGQWRSLHGIGPAPSRSGQVDGQQHRVWLNDDGAAVVEEYRIAGMGHGTPLKTRGERSCGAAGAYMLEAGISSTWQQAHRWGLIDASADSAPVTGRSSPPADAASPDPAPRPPAAPSPVAPIEPASAAPTLTATIEHALRSAGLMR